jgi:hypothetical protein
MIDKEPPYISDDFQIGPQGAYEHENTTRMIYESPDKGRTVYERRMNHTENRTKLKKYTEEEWVALNNAIPIRQEYPELEATVTLCNDMIWDSIYDQYSMEQYPPFGGPFTDSVSFIDWLKQNYMAPKRIK